MLVKSIMGLAVVASIALVGCGGGSSIPKKVTKVIMDDPIVGLGYQCSSSDEMKKTDNEGKFTCNEGDTVSFFIGKYEISTDVDVASGTADTMRIADLGITAGAVTDIRQVLQTIDQDDDGLMVIPEDFDTLNDVIVAPGSENFDDKVGEKLENETGNELVSGETADKHANERYLKYLLSGKTFYFVSHKYTSPAVMEVRFNTSLTNISFFKDSEAKGVGTLDLNGSRVTMHNGGEDTTFSVEDKSRYIVVHAERNGHQFDAKMYTDLSDAQKQYDEEIAGDTDLKVLLAGKTFYIISHDGMSKAVFNKAFTQVYTAGYLADGSIDPKDEKTEKINIDGDKLITNKSGDYIKFKSSTDDYLLFYGYNTNDVLEEQSIRAYHEKAKAKAYLATLGGGGSADEGITQQMLDGKWFYMIEHSGEEGTDYRKMRLRNGKISGVKVIMKDGAEQSRKSINKSYTIVDGKVSFDGMYMILLSKNSQSWRIKFQNIHDSSEEYNYTLYLSKPAGYPNM